MSFFNTLKIASTGLSAQRIRINVIASNMAHVNTTKSDDEGGLPYKKRNVIFEQVLNGKYKGGVKVRQVVKDKNPYMLKYEPGHRDADEEGYVAYPNINPIEEMVNLLEASRSYESNVTIVNTAKQLAQQAISISRR